MTPLSWQPPPVTKCEECFYRRYSYINNEFYCGKANYLDRTLIYHQNAYSITESCPAWQQQNKDKK